MASEAVGRPFSVRVAQAWKLGRKGKDNGILLLISRDDRKLRIEVGYGLEGTLTDLRSNEIIDQVIRPRFRQGDLDGGVPRTGAHGLEIGRAEPGRCHEREESRRDLTRDRAVTDAGAGSVLARLLLPPSLRLGEGPHSYAAAI